MCAILSQTISGGAANAALMLASAGLANFSAQAPWGLGTTRFVSAPAAFTDSPGGD